MNEYKCYQEISSKVYKKADWKRQYLLFAIILFAIGGLFLIKAPDIEACIVTAIAVAFGFGFINKMFNSLQIDMNNERIIQKSSLLARTQIIAFSDIQNFNISNNIYVLVLISSAYALVERKGKSKYILLGQSFMNSKHTQQLLLETERIIGRR
ncbi:hypothetical protein LZQ00_02490 [Sphingobacterium sp. SRCM116780]|uniref:hypothetical protein n=1 Tax=Sphingobacterium sp. SRCM116780 TaxID=2907623 RepID=UPI001F3BF8E3|nr:hypothetical protein [Sphingobacterium sp. SRCM116780]UIR56693.1 hypothetical protein LZQ00_02490 [Sphingobacterium sp. SRCM116780]